MVTREQIQKARTADLYAWASAHPGLFTAEGDSFRLRSDHSVSIRRGYCGWKDFSGGNVEKVDRGNAIDFLVCKLGLPFCDAVLELCGGGSDALTLTPQGEPIRPPFVLPDRGASQARLFAYLCKTRRLPAPLIQSMLENRLLFQDTRGNVIFHSGDEWAEVRGTLTNKPFHGIIKGSRSDGCWRFRIGYTPTACYICESAIDALSLACLLGVSAWFVSIGGASKQAAIDRIKRGKYAAIIATDNDEAGNACAARNPDLQRLVPPTPAKDWNEALIDGLKIHDTT